MHSSPANPADVTFPAQTRASGPRQHSFKELSREAGFWQEARLIRKALDLAGQPNSILDLPCGTGRLWPILLEKHNRMIIGADNCAEMLAVARDSFPSSDLHKLHFLQTAPDAIDLPDSAIDCIFCMRLFSWADSAAQRRQLLREFHRVSRDTLILSLWVDGNYQAWRRQASGGYAPSETAEAHTHHIVPKPLIEAEFATAGFDRLGHFDLLPFFHMTRIYVLRKQ